MLTLNSILARQRMKSSFTQADQTVDDRRGSVLLVVIGLLGMLLLAGIAFYTFASQESSSADEFCEAAKESRQPTMQADALFNFGLEQLILGPDDTQVHSALRGGRGTNPGQLPWGRHSLLAGLLGNDTTPYNGFGIHLQSDGSGNPFVDQDYDGLSDNPNLLNIINFSASANGGTAPPVLSTLPAVDTGVTSPDINSPYLSYRGTGLNGSTDVDAFIPSFHRPQYRLGAGWQTNAATATRVFRPHPNHVCANNPSRARFLSVATTSPSGQLVSPFPFVHSSGMNQGVWDLNGPGAPAPFQYDVDNDGDSIREGVWLDLDHPVQELSDGRRFVPLFSFTVVDADGLVNLNVSGNSNSFIAPAAPGTLDLGASGGHISRSNLGLSRSEINPQWGLLADPTNTIVESGSNLNPTIDNEYRVFWNLPTATTPTSTIPRLAVANRDWFHILHGRVTFMKDPSSPLMMPRYRLDSDDHQPRSYFFGKWENPLTESNFQYALANNMVISSNTGVDFSILPGPGRLGIDDDGDLMAGRARYNNYLNYVPSMGHPFDPTGHGIRLQLGGTGLQRMRGTYASAQFPAYFNYQGLSEFDINGNVFADSGVEDSNGNGRLDGVEDLNRNGKLDSGEDANGNGQLDWGEDINHNYALDIEDLNGNGTFDLNVGAFPNYQIAGGATLFTAGAFLQDEADESVAEPGLAIDNPATRADMPFNYEEEFGLHGVDADLSSMGFASRLRNLAPANFKSSNLAALIRSQYCVSSFDRIQFSAGLNNQRSGWEINADMDSDGLFEFPPAVFTVATPATPIGANPLEPIRTPLRRLLQTEYTGLSPSGFVTQFRLNMNQFLSGYRSTGPVYRELYPHPADPGNGVIPLLSAMLGVDGLPGTMGVDDDGNGITDFLDVDGNGAYTPGTDLYDYNEIGSGDDYGPNTLPRQEFWARRDRQQMARDIYVMLYLLGGGNDAFAYTADNSGRALYTNAQLAEMAQFAVNYVDSQDHDDVMTKFEYDRNLGDGWNLGDNPYETADDAIVATDRAVVYGVEAQQLTWSEVLGIISRQVRDSSNNPVNHVATQINDDAGDRYYTWMELRNASPYAIDLSTGGWQIAVQDDPDGTPESGDETDRVQLTLYSGDTTTTVLAGGLFTIGTRGGPAATNPSNPVQNLRSFMHVDSTGAASPTFNASTQVAPTSTALDLDLIPTTAGSSHDSTRSLLTDGSGPIPGAGNTVGTAGNFLYGGTGGNVSAAQEGQSHLFVLRRRVNPHRTAPVTYTSSNVDHVNQSNDNPWVEVDRIVMPTWRVFALADSDGSTQVQTKLTNLTSWERSQPLTRTTAGEGNHAAASSAPYQANSIGSQNSNSTLPFNLFQLHFDREFSAPTDMFSIPLYGPRNVTYRGGQNVLFDESSSTAMLAQERFLRPRHYSNFATPPGNVNLDNRWYRLLEMLEVPTQTHSTVTAANSPFHLRTPGKINLNTLRHRGTLAGLLDDWGTVSGLGLGGTFDGAFPFYTNMLDDGERDWWNQLLTARDGTDPLTGMILPGMAHSRPFRGLNYLDQGVASIEDTVLRSLPADSGLGRRGLFEARTSGDLAANSVDPLTRHRLLQKVVNNSTTRSNVFLVWMTVGYFEAIQHTNGDVQIGGPLNGARSNRGFFVIDRTLPEKGYNSQVNRFDFKKFVQYRKTIQ